MTPASTKGESNAVLEQLKLIILLLTIYFVVGLIPLYLLYSLAIDSLNTEAGLRLEIAAAVGAEFVDGAAHSRVQSADDIGNEDYTLVKKQMRRILKVYSDARIVHVYSLRKNKEAADPKEGTFFVIDSAELNDFNFFNEDDIAAFGSPYCLGPAMKEAFDGSPSSTDFLYGNQCGTWRTGYAPLYDNAGNIDAILCVDGSTEDTLLRMRKIYAWSIFSLISNLVFIFLLTIILGIRKRKKLNSSVEKA